MRLKMQPRSSIFGDHFDVTDENGMLVFRVDWDPAAAGREIRLSDAEGKDVYVIRREPSALGARYEIVQKGDTLVTIKRGFGQTRFKLDGAVKKYEVQGDCFSHDYEVKLDEVPFARAWKSAGDPGDTYGLEMAEGQPADYAIVTALAVAFDEVSHPPKSKSGIFGNLLGR
jgi:uncharacterized protein YxjI